MDNNICLRMDEVTSLLTDRFHDLGMTVTGIRHADAAGEVQELSAIICINIRTFCTISNEVEDSRQGRRHVMEVISIELVGHLFPFMENPVVE
jgi:hypothetical protein